MGPRKSQKPRMVVGYVRVSSEMQVADGESLARQEEQIRAYCAREGVAESELEIISDGGISGAKANRRGYQRLMQLCTSRQVRMVVAYNLDRLSRDTLETLQFEAAMKKHGVKLVTLQQEFDTSTPIGKAQFTFNAMFNQLYRDEIAFKTKAALAHKRSKGEKTGGIVPFGYTLVDGVRLAPLPGEIETIRQIHQLRKKGLSLRQIVGELNRQGIKTKTGKSKWSPQVVSAILERQISQITQDPSIPDQEKDALLEDVTGALYDTQDLSVEDTSSTSRSNRGSN